MAPFEQLQELWQRQPRHAVPPAEVAELARMLRAYARRQNWILGAKAVVVGLVLAWSFANVRSSRPGMTGLVLVAIVAALLLLDDWRAQGAIARRNFAAPSAGFVHETIDRLLARRDVRRRYAVLIGAIVLGVNLMTPARPLWVRVFSSALPFAGFEFGLMIRRKRFDHECGPLIERLRAMQAALEESFE
jgi:4-amino-4-deoxy-L-arabinose transferase-like glycosyltransferase